MVVYDQPVLSHDQLTNQIHHRKGMTEEEEEEIFLPSDCSQRFRNIPYYMFFRSVVFFV